MVCTFPHLHTVFNQLECTFSKCYFINYNDACAFLIQVNSVYQIKISI